MSDVETVGFPELEHVPPDPIHFLVIINFKSPTEETSLTYLAVLLHQIFFTELGVDLGPVEDASGPGGVVEGGEGLLHVDGGGGDGGDDGGLGPPAQRVLEQPGQFGLPVGDVRGPLHQVGDHPPEGEQALVDVSSFPDMRKSDLG